MMPNRMYQRGNAFERRVKTDLEKQGYVCFQTRGSKTATDIVASQAVAVLLVQVKSGTTQVSHIQWNALVDLAFKAYAEPIIADRDGRKIRYRRITGYHQSGSRHWPADEYSP